MAPAALEKSIDVLAAVAALKDLWKKEGSSADPLVPSRTSYLQQQQQKHQQQQQQQEKEEEEGEANVIEGARRREERPDQGHDLNEADKADLTNKVLLRLQQLKTKQQQQQQQRQNSLKSSILLAA